MTVASECQSFFDPQDPRPRPPAKTDDVFKIEQFFRTRSGIIFNIAMCRTGFSREHNYDIRLVLQREGAEWEERGTSRGATSVYSRKTVC
jgi:hypothetical protein